MGPIGVVPGVAPLSPTSSMSPPAPLAQPRSAPAHPGNTAAVVADALSYHPVTTAKIATQSGVTWSRYAPDDHTRTGDS
jgi:hypothetical protein